jgi:hypothetical protein
MISCQMPGPARLKARTGKGLSVALDQLLALLACALLAALAVFQDSLIAGAPFGHLAWGGQHRILPAKLKTGSAVSIALYTLFAYTALTMPALFRP